MNAMTSNASEWILTQFSRQAALSKRPALFVIVAIILSIALADYFSEIRVSLTVFYFVPILLGVAWLGSKAAIGVALASILFKVIGDLIEAPDGALPLWGWWNAASTLLVLLLVVWVFGNLLAVYRKLEERVAERTKQIFELSEHRRLLEHELLTVSLNERNLMGQELHDEICQHLVGTTLAAQVLCQRLLHQNNALASDAQAIISLIEAGIGKTRQLAQGLLLSEIEPAQLPERLSELVDEADGAGVSCRFRQTGTFQVADPATAAQLYRIAQEALRNAIRHAGASHVVVALAGDQRNVCLSVEDDGRGLLHQEASSGMGVPIMSHRAAYIGATLSLTPMAGRGTRMTCIVPHPLEPSHGQ